MIELHKNLLEAVTAAEGMARELRQRGCALKDEVEMLQGLAVKVRTRLAAYESNSQSPIANSQRGEEGERGDRKAKIGNRK